MKKLTFPSKELLKNDILLSLRPKIHRNENNRYEIPTKKLNDLILNTEIKVCFFIAIAYDRGFLKIKKIIFFPKLNYIIKNWISN